MNIFKFFSKKKDNTSSKGTHVPQPTPLQQFQNNKEIIADFFNTDILHLNHNDYKDRVVLDVPEMGMFYFVDARYVNGSLSNITFLSFSKILSPELINFVEKCANTFGPTQLGETSITSRDYFLLEKGLFSRMWKDLWVDCGPDDDNARMMAIRLTIFSPEKTGLIKLV